MTQAGSSHPLPLPDGDAVEPLLETSIDINATPAQVWALVSDLPRLAEWSPQVVRSWVRGGGPVRAGSRLFNLNRRGLLFWPTRSTVVRYEPHREVAFRIDDNFSVWSFTLEPLDSGERTRLIHSRRVDGGLSGISVLLTKWVFGGQQSFGQELVDGMNRTVSGVRRLAESA